MTAARESISEQARRRSHAVSRATCSENKPGSSSSGWYVLRKCAVNRGAYFQAAYTGGPTRNAELVPGRGLNFCARPLPTSAT
jgi:hypothetical protein